jgi:putative peptidoglycan lipid II flippase
MPVMGIQAAIPILAVAVAVALVFQLCFLPERRGLVFRQAQSKPRPEGRMRRVLLLMAPLAVGVVFSHISDLVDNLLASRLADGELSYLSYAKRVLDALLLIGPVPVTVIMFTELSRLASDGAIEKVRTSFATAARLLIFLSVPATVLLLELRRPILSCLFQHGRFDAGSTAGTSAALLAYGSGFVLLAVEGLVVSTFFALSDTKTPVILGVISVILNVALAVWLCWLLGYVGIALALVIAKSAKIIALAGWLQGKLHARFVNRNSILFCVKLLAASAGLWCVAKNHHVSEMLMNLGSAGRLLVTGGLAIAAFTGLALLLRMQEPRQLISMLFRRMPRAVGPSR